MQEKQINLMAFQVHSFLLFFLIPSLNHVAATGTGASSVDYLNGETPNPFTPKAYVIRYWNKRITSNLPQPPPFLLSKASPMNMVDAAAFTELAAQGAISSHLPAFCAAARLLCFPELSPSLDKHDKDSNFTTYIQRNFTNYGTGKLGGMDSFSGYADGANMPTNLFGQYSHNSATHLDSLALIYSCFKCLALIFELIFPTRFENYGHDGNVADQGFNGYGASSTGGRGEFQNYNEEVNVPNLKFNNYGSDGNGRAHTFSSYTRLDNSGDEKFTSYGRNGNGGPDEFNSYGNDSNAIRSSFTGYSERANGPNDTFTNYGINGNMPENDFKRYSKGGNAGGEKFSNYREHANVGDDLFTSYGKDSIAGKVNFMNYGKSFNGGTDTFTRYGHGSREQEVGFEVYGMNSTFKEYSRKVAVTFASYTNKTVASTTATRDK
ncbi:hypothetical protein CRG98_036976, partial [Punica granatum]